MNTQCPDCAKLEKRFNQMMRDAVRLREFDRARTRLLLLVELAATSNSLTRDERYTLNRTVQQVNDCFFSGQGDRDVLNAVITKANEAITLMKKKHPISAENL